MKLSEFAENSGISYLKAWRMYKNHEIPGAHKTSQGSIIIPDPDLHTTPFNQATLNIEWPEPLSTEFQLVEKASSTRNNKSANISPTDRYKHIDDSLTPFNVTKGTYGSSDITIRDAIILCQKAYYGFSLFRLTIDLMTEFCVSEIDYRGGSEKSRAFFKAYHKKIGIWGLQDMWYREYFRSSNVFFYRFEGEVKPADLKQITQTFGAATAPNKRIPIRYAILNPADINAAGNISFADVQYYQVISDYELERLRSPRTEEDKQVLDSLDPETKKLILSQRSGTVLLPIDREKILASFYKKQSYEAFAVPMGFPVLEDINFKKEMRLMDQALMRTCQQAILLITTGAEPEKGGINKNNIEILQRIFENGSVARVLVADYTTKADFKVPQIGDILDPKKYETVDKDIAIGLNNVLLGDGEKFANQQTKIEVFVKRLEHARRVFLNEFLGPEIKRVAKSVGLKNYPEPFYQEIDLKNELEYSKIYTRLTELGVLTAEEGIEAIQSGKLPTPEESTVSQQKYKSSRDKGLYQPLVGGAKDPNANGRPAGSKAPQTTKKVSPIGASYSLTKIKDIAMAHQELQSKLDKYLLSKYKIKKLNKDQKEVASQITGLIIANEEKENWNDKIEFYVNNPVDTNLERVREIQEIAAEHQLDFYSASLLSHTKI